MKKYLVGVGTALALLAGLAIPVAQASALTASQISAIVSLLQSFGADQTTVNNVQVALGGSPSSTSGQAFCYTFNNDLSVGSSGADVNALNQALSASGIDISGNTSTFSENTAADVVTFQAKYGIRQTGYVGPVTRNQLNLLYGCGNQTTQPSTPQPVTSTPVQSSASLTITYPTYGAILQIGQTYNITWKIPDSEQSVNNFAVYLVGGSLGSTGSIFLGTAYLPAHFGATPTFQWTVPSTIQPGSGYQIEFSGKGATGGNSASFSISNSSQTPTSPSATPTITVTYPQSGNILDDSGAKDSGQIATIQWSSTNLGSLNVNIDLLANGIIVKNIAQNVPNTGSFVWPYDLTLKNGTYQIEVSSFDKGPSAQGLSGSFQIVNSPAAPQQTIPSSNQPSITVTSPKAGDILTAGQTYPISWTSQNLGNQVVFINLLDPNGNLVAFLNNGTPNTNNGSYLYSWNVGSSINTNPGASLIRNGNYQIVVGTAELNTNAASGKSGIFTISNSTSTMGQVPVTTNISPNPTSVPVTSH
jgi:Putative peptidoglycan binding domain